MYGDLLNTKSSYNLISSFCRKDFENKFNFEILGRAIWSENRGKCDGELSWEVTTTALGSYEGRYLEMLLNILHLIT